MKKLLISAIAFSTLFTNATLFAFAAEANKTEAPSINESVTTETMSIKSTITVKATAYAGDTITSTGTTPKWGTLAVDPKIIPYGTKIYIPQFDQVFIAEDCGSAIKGNRIDIFMDTEDNCNNWGVRDIEIHILN